MTAMPPIASDGRGRRIAGLALLALGEAAAAGLIAFAMRDVFAAFHGSDSPLPWVPLAAIGGGGCVIAGLRAAGRVLAERLGQDYAAALRLALFEHVARMPAREVARHRRGALALRFTGDLAAVRGWISRGIARLITAAIVLPLVGAVLFLLDWQLGAAATAPLALGLAAMALVGRQLGPIHRRLRSRRARLASEMSERLPHGPELRLLGRLGTERRLLARRTDRMVRAATQRAAAAGVLRSLPDAASGLAAVSVLLVALAGGLPAAAAAGALAGVGIMAQTMRELAGVADRHRAWAEARRRAEALIAAPRLRRPAAPAGARLPKGPPALCFDRVATGVLRRVDAEAAPGRRIAVMGANGAGKSTLLALAAGLEQPRRGRVSLAGIAPASLAPRDRRAIHHVGPGSPILAGSLRRALTIGAVRRPDDRVVTETAEAFGLGPVLARLGGLDGSVAEEGRNLSAGETRRVLLARAALSGARLLLLDEPDDALDAQGAELVLRLIRESAATCLLATHDPALAARLDEVWWLRDGGVIRADAAAAQPVPVET